MVLLLFFQCRSSGSHRLTATATEAFAIGIEKGSVAVKRARIPVQMDFATCLSGYQSRWLEESVAGRDLTGTC